MKHVWHLVGADVRRFRLLLAVWVILQIADTVFRGIRPGLVGDPRLGMAVELVAAVLFLLRWLGLIVIVPLVVQTHPLVGSDAFWMTRPIPWRALLASKVVLLATMFVAVAALCEFVLMLVSRVPVWEIVLVTLQTILFQSLWLFIVMALATTTRNLARFALVVGSVLVGFLLLINTLIAVLMRNMPDGPQLTTVSGRSVGSPTVGVLMLTLLIVAALVQVVVQYRTRSTRLSVAAGVIGLAVAVLIVLMWPAPGRPLPVPEWARQPSALRLVAESQKGEFRAFDAGSPWGRSSGWQMGSARLRLGGIEAGWIPTVALAEGTVQFDAGTTLTTAGNGYSSNAPFASVDDAPLRVVMRQVLGVARVQEGWQARLGTEVVPVIVVSQADFATHMGKTGTYRGRFLVNLDQVAIAGTLPLRAGAEFQNRGRRIVIDQVIPQAQAASIRLRQYIAATMFSSDSAPRVSFYLRNRDRAEAVAGSGHEGFAMASGVGLAALFGGAGFSAEPGSGFSVSGSFIRFPGNPGSDEQVVDISADWLSRAELVIVHTVTAGSVTRTLEIPGFEIAAAPPRTPR
jgi:hypothetical protein